MESRAQASVSTNMKCNCSAIQGQQPVWRAPLHNEEDRATFTEGHFHCWKWRGWFSCQNAFMPLDTPWSPGASKLPVGPHFPPQTPRVICPGTTAHLWAPNPPLGCAACPPCRAGFGLWAGVRCEQHAAQAEVWDSEHETFSWSTVTTVKRWLGVRLQHVKPLILESIPTVSAAPRTQSPRNRFVSFPGHDELGWQRNMRVQWIIYSREGRLPAGREWSPPEEELPSSDATSTATPLQTCSPRKSKPKTPDKWVHFIILSGQLQALRQLCKAIF